MFAHLLVTLLNRVRIYKGLYYGYILKWNIPDSEEKE